jgi:hypothetical protein
MGYGSLSLNQFGGESETPVSSPTVSHPDYEKPLSLSSQTRGSNAAGSVFKSEDIANRPGHIAGYNKQNRGTTYSWDSESPIEAPKSDKGTNF